MRAGTSTGGVVTVGSDGSGAGVIGMASETDAPELAADGAAADAGGVDDVGFVSGVGVGGSGVGAARFVGVP